MKKISLLLVIVFVLNSCNLSKLHEGKVESIAQKNFDFKSLEIEDVNYSNYKELLNKTRSINQTQSFKDAVQEVEKQLEEYKKIMDQYPESSEEYINAKEIYDFYELRAISLVYSIIRWQENRGDKVTKRVNYKGEYLGSVDYSISDEGINSNGERVINIFLEESRSPAELDKDVPDSGDVWETIKYYLTLLFNPMAIMGSGDWQANALVDPVPFVTEAGTLMVHEGIVEYYKNIVSDIDNEIINISSSNSNANIRITGYSQGGALATLLHYHLKTNSGLLDLPKMDLDTVTFGSPGIVKMDGDTLISSLRDYSDKTNDIIHFVYGYDILPYLVDTNYIPEGWMRYIGDMSKEDRHVFKYQELNDITPLPSDYIFSLKLTNGRNLPEEGVERDLQFSAEITKIINGNFDNSDHAGYYDFLGDRDSFDSFNGDKIHSYPNGTKLRHPDRDRIYLVESGVLRHIPNAEVFNNLFNNWDYIYTTDVDNLPIGKPLELDTELFRINNSASIYLKDGNEQRLIISREVFESYDFNWSKVVNRSEGYAEGNVLHPYNDGVRIKSPTASALYLIDKGVLRHIPSSTVNNRLFEDSSNIVYSNDVNFINKGEVISDDAQLYSPTNDSKVYFRENGILRHIGDRDTFERYNFSWGKISSN